MKEIIEIKTSTGETFTLSYDEYLKNKGEYDRKFAEQGYTILPGTKKVYTDKMHVPEGVKSYTLEREVSNLPSSAERYIQQLEQEIAKLELKISGHYFREDKEFFEMFELDKDIAMANRSINEIQQLNNLLEDAKVRSVQAVTPEEISKIKIEIDAINERLGELLGIREVSLKEEELRNQISLMEEKLKTATSIDEKLEIRKKINLLTSEINEMKANLPLRTSDAIQNKLDELNNIITQSEARKAEIKVNQDNNYVDIPERKADQERLEQVKKELALVKKTDSQTFDLIQDSINKNESGLQNQNDINKIFNKIKELNPDVQLKFEIGASGSPIIYSSVPAEKLILPENFRYDEKNGITNKHNTEDGVYTSIDVKPLTLTETSPGIDQPETTLDEPSSIGTDQPEVDPVQQDGVQIPQGTHSRGRREFRVTGILKKGWKWLKDHPLLIAGGGLLASFIGGPALVSSAILMGIGSLATLTGTIGFVVKYKERKKMITSLQRQLETLQRQNAPVQQQNDPLTETQDQGGRTI